MVTPSKTGLSTIGAQPAGTLPRLDPLDQELGKDDVNDIFGNYFEEQQSTVRDLLNPGLTGSESPEAMDVDLALPSSIRLWRLSPQRLHWEPSNQS